MTKTRQRRLLLIGLLLVGLAAATALGLSAFRENLLYFHPPSDVVAGKIPDNTRFRLGGLVKDDSVEHLGEGMRVHFRIKDCDHDVPVVFKGSLPDLFREGQGVTASGYLDDQGVFIADQVLAKHDSNYMSPEEAEALQASGQDTDTDSCMPSQLQAQQ